MSKETKKDHQINIRVTSAERDDIFKKAKLCKLSLSKYIIKQALNKNLNVETINTVQLDTATRYLLKNLTNNINQIAHQLNMQDKVKTHFFTNFDYEGKLKNLNELLVKIKSLLK